MKVFRSGISTLIWAFLFVSITVTDAKYNFTCPIYTPCEGTKVVCPDECPDFSMNLGPEYTKYCQPNCGGVDCQPFCRPIYQSCDSPGSVCYDPRFIGADGGVFYFHGKSNEHFSLVSDRKLQINARFIGHRPTGRPRDFTWIQALGILFNSSHSFSVEAAKAETWDENTDHLKFTYEEQEIIVPEGALGTWVAPKQNLVVKRTAKTNRAIISIPGLVDVLINVAPVTKQDDRIHGYKVPSDDCFAHLEVQFRFSSLSPQVEGVLGHTYRPDFVNPAKPGSALPVLGGEDKYRTSSLLTADCKTCIYSPGEVTGEGILSMLQYNTLDCTWKLSGGNGIVCKK